MKSLFTLCFTLITVSCLLAINPVKGKIETKKIESIEEGSAVIDSELNELLEASELIKAENLSYDEFSVTHNTIAEELNIESGVDTGLLEGSENSPVGIPGFWWGFCFGILGLVVVYVAMEDGQERKEQAKNALYGCIISTVVFTLFYVGLFALAAT